MPSLCAASFSILTLNDEDLGSLNVSSAAFSSRKTLVERRIDISLGCNFTANGPEISGRKLEVIVWNNGATDLCGSCSFCTLLVDSMQRSVESDFKNAWHLNSILDTSVSSWPLELRAVIHFEKLEYRMNCLPTAFTNQGLWGGSNWDVYLLLMSGYVLLNPKNVVPGAESRGVEVDLAFELFGEEDDPVVKFLQIHRRPLYGPRGSDQNTAKIRNWIKDCDEHHEGCWAGMKDLKYKAPAEAITFLPTRMIDVGNSLNKQHPKLVITSDMQPSASKDEPIKYMALSYCWGTATSKLLKTTHDTIGSRLEQIELDIMPQTFQDAVAVARSLDIQYLWIDSLCIIQDDDRDWQIQSSKMAEIFSNAYLTLISASGSGCNDSFLSRRLPDISCSIPLSLPGKAITGQFSLRFRRRWGTSDKMSEITGGK